ncbi:hypothetical protein GC330_00360 [Yersinia pestis]|uniref:hypothetical protein n=1 Tax=Yersinia pestis TaxID=632 RepID=UPI0001D04400|nr:hypothetical protein [Yersinia pestis]ADE63236.1 hypothetical protein YPZ3_0326 [Yersinia pestis Z176003]MBE7735576.1 hypothetical protein [Yersinia pestis]MBE7739355.1 hypothetical protein [Yersinia pestis]MBE7743804.1 hypothetical protein [Yersinia pestis]MBE7751322.1 hypothetical protein [Yersinia pestis]
MFRKKIMLVFIASLLATACSLNDIKSINQKVSDGASSITKVMNGEGNNSDMPYMQPARQQKKESKSQDYSIPVDVDTAAARIKRHYKFISNEEVEAIRKKDTRGGWVTGAITDANQVWDAMPGSYYKMGSDWGNYGDHLNIEIEKNGSGSRLYITYSTPSQKRLESNDLQLLMKDIKQVAEGQLR